MAVSQNAETSEWNQLLTDFSGKIENVDGTHPPALREVVLETDDGMPTRCAVTLDNIGEAWKAMLVDRVTSLTPTRMREVCDALDTAVGC